MTQEMVEFWDGRGISWTTRKQSAPRCRQITTPAPSHSIFTDWMLLVTPNQQCQSTEGREAGTNNSLHQESVRQLYTQKDRHTDRWGAAELCFPPVRPAVRACVRTCGRAGGGILQQNPTGLPSIFLSRLYTASDCEHLLCTWWTTVCFCLVLCFAVNCPIPLNLLLRDGIEVQIVLVSKRQLAVIVDCI